MPLERYSCTLCPPFHPMSSDFHFQVHVGAQDEVFASEQAIDGLVATAQALVVQADIFKYPGAGHFFTDRALADYSEAAANLTWHRV